MFKDNKLRDWKDVKWSRSSVFFVNFEHISQILLEFYCRLWTVESQLGLLNIKIYN